MTRVHLYASRQHYHDHGRPIYDALPSDVRGGVLSARTSDPWRAGRTLPLRDVPADDWVMVAAHVDAKRFPRNPVIYVEHGAGQTYGGDPAGVANPSYSGGESNGNVRLFVCPSTTVAGRWRAAYPNTPVAVVGCPKLDDWHRWGGRRSLSDPMMELHRPDQGGTVAFTFHWENTLVPESRSALPHYQRHMAAVVDELRSVGWRVLGHGHPRAHRSIQQMWRQLSVPFVPDLAYVLDHAHVLVADNTSAMYEAAACGLGVVALNAPWYRRDVEHGLRFWSHVPGRMADDAIEVVPLVNATNDAIDRQLRADATAHAYAYLDGRASERAATAIMEAISG